MESTVWVDCGTGDGHLGSNGQKATDRIYGLEPRVCFAFDELAANEVFGGAPGHAGALPVGGELARHGPGKSAEASAGPRGGGEGAGGGGDVPEAGEAGQGHGRGRAGAWEELKCSPSRGAIKEGST